MRIYNWSKLINNVAFLFSIFILHAQNQTISGDIIDANNLPIPYANVIVNDTLNTTNSIAFGYSNDEGYFELKIPKIFKKVELNITAIGFTEKTFFLNTDTTKNLKITLEESITELDQVIIKAKRTTDTLNIDINNMNLGKENTLRDMLNKTDGIIVSKDGGISYQGKQIKKVFVNGKEVFVNQNKVALDNLNYEIMENVQIINNYKDKFTIDFNRIRDPVINIETKSKFKGIIKTNLDLGYGHNDKFKINGKGFFFSDHLNAFATTHNNNVGEIELSNSDVTKSITKYSTDFLNNNLFPFFIGDVQAKKYFISNNSFTTRWQGSSSKTGIVLYYGNIDKERETRYNTFISDTLIRTSKNKNNYSGNFISATANYSHLISSKVVLQNLLNSVIVQQKESISNLDTLFVPTFTAYGEKTNNTPKSFTLTNALKLTSLINDDTALDFGINYYYEKDSRDFKTKLTNTIFEDINQNSSLLKQHVSFFGNMKFRLENTTINSGIAYTYQSENGSLKYDNNLNQDVFIRRKIKTINAPVNIQGSIKKLDYNIAISPTVFGTNEKLDRFFFKTSNDLTYYFEQQNNLIAKYSYNYNFFDPNSLFDTIVNSYTNVIINNKENLTSYSKTHTASLGWFNSNVARSKRINFNYTFRREEDFLQSVLDSISNNILFYSNQIFDKKYTHTINAGINKGYYIGSSYHRLDIGGNFLYNLNDYPTIINTTLTQVKVNSWEPTLHLGFSPRNFFIKEIKNSLRQNHLTFKIDGNDASKQTILTNLFTLEGSGEKIDWKFDFEYKLYDIDNEKFNVPDCGLSFRYDLSDNVAFTLTGQSLLTLFNLNNYRFTNTTSNGNIFTQVINNNNLGYLILSTVLKL